MAVTFEPFDPKKHKGAPTHEIATVEIGDDVGSEFVPTDVSREEASQIPWFYVVQSGDD